MKWFGFVNEFIGCLPENLPEKIEDVLLVRGGRVEAIHNRVKRDARGPCLQSRNVKFEDEVTGDMK